MAYCGLGKKPEFWPTLMTAAMLITLIGLGVWQMQRLEWKQELLEAADKALKGKPELLLRHGEQTLDVPFKYVRLQGGFYHDKELYLAGKYHKGHLGYHILTPYKMVDGRIVLVNRGWVPKEKKDSKTRPETLPAGLYVLDGIARQLPKKNMFTPDNDPKANQWFWYDIVAMSQAVGMSVQPYVVVAVRKDEADTSIPVAAKKEINLRNDHFAYALTWFGMAVALVVIWFAYHRSRAREEQAAATASTEQHNDSSSQQA